MGKFFFTQPERNGDVVCFTSSAAHHMIHVLRYRIGREIILCDGNSTDFHAKVEGISSKPDAITFKLLSHSPSNTEPATPVTLYQGLPKSDKMDWIIEKSIEAGVHKIIPVCTARTVVKVKDASRKAERFTRISESAASQSMRGIIPMVLPPIAFSDALQKHNGDSLHLIAYENEQVRTLKDAISGLLPQPISLWVGPEGGFDDNEIKILEENGAIPITLGPRILRTETASLIALAQIFCLWD